MNKLDINLVIKKNYRGFYGIWDHAIITLVTQLFK